MKASTQRAVVRWLHILSSIPIAGYIYGPVAGIPRAAFAVRWVIVPVVALSGLWLWKGHLLKRHIRSRAVDRGGRGEAPGLGFRRPSP